MGTEGHAKRHVFVTLKASDLDPTPPFLKRRAARETELDMKFSNLQLK